MAEEIPSYLNEDLFVKSIKGGLKCEGDVVVRNYTIKKATVSGDNYISDVFRCRVDYSTSTAPELVETISLIMKCMPQTDASRDSVIADLNVFEKEVDMFVNVIPDFSASLNEFFAAKCFYSTEDPVKIIVLEDLKDRNFRLAIPTGGLDFSHCQLIMEKIGKFHAASMAFAKTNPEKLKAYNYGLFNPSNSNTVIPDIFSRGLETLVKVAETKWSDFDQEIIDKLRKLQNALIPRLKACFEQDNTTGINVLNHGDLWLNNMMFSYDDQTNAVENVVFVDYQVSYFTSLGLDLNYCLSTCPTSEVRENRRDDLVQIYYKSLVEGLNHLKYEKIPTHDDILQEIRKMQFWGFSSAVCVLPIAILEKKEEAKPSFEAMVNEETSVALREVAYTGAKYQEAIKPILRRYNKLKVFD